MEFATLDEAIAHMRELRSRGLLPHVHKPTMYRFMVHESWRDFARHMDASFYAPDCETLEDTPTSHMLCLDSPRCMRLDLESVMSWDAFHPLVLNLLWRIECVLRTHLERLPGFQEAWLEYKVCGRKHQERRQSVHVTYPHISFVDQVCEFRAMHYVLDALQVLGYTDEAALLDMNPYTLSARGGSLRMAFTHKAPGDHASFLYALPPRTSAVHWRQYYPMYDPEEVRQMARFSRRHFPETPQERTFQERQDALAQEPAAPLALDPQHQWLMPWCERVVQQWWPGATCSVWRADVPVVYIDAWDVYAVRVITHLRQTLRFSQSKTQFQRIRFKLMLLRRALGHPWRRLWCDCAAIRTDYPPEPTEAHERKYQELMRTPLARPIVVHQVCQSLMRHATSALPQVRSQCLFHQEECRPERFSLRVRADARLGVYVMCNACRVERMLGSGMCERPEHWFVAKYVDDHFRGVLPADVRTLAINSACGTGKTTFLHALLQSYSPDTQMLAITCRRTLADTLVHKLPNFSDYRLIDRRYSDFFQGIVRDRRRLVIQLDSLRSLARDFARKRTPLPHVKFVVLDEYYSLLLHFLSTTLTQARILVFDTFKYLLQHAEHVIVLDADFMSTDEPYRFLCDVRPQGFEVYRNLSFPRPRKTFTLMDYAPWWTLLTQRIEAGQLVALLSNSKEELDGMMATLRPLTSSVFTSASQETADNNIRGLSQSGPHCQIIAFTPKITVGVDYIPDEDEDRPIFVWATPHSADASTITQMAQRFRRQQQVYIYVKPRANKAHVERATDTQAVIDAHRDEIDTCSAYAEDALEVDSATGLVQVRQECRSLLRLLAWAKAHQTRSKLNFVQEITRCLRQQGQMLIDAREKFSGRPDRTDELAATITQQVRARYELVGRLMAGEAEEQQVASREVQDVHDELVRSFGLRNMCAQHWAYAYYSLPEMIAFAAACDPHAHVAEAYHAGFQVVHERLMESTYYRHLANHSDQHDMNLMKTFFHQRVRLMRSMFHAAGLTRTPHQMWPDQLVSSRTILSNIPDTLVPLLRRWSTDKYRGAMLQEVFNLTQKMIDGDITQRNLHKFLNKTVAQCGLTFDCVQVIPRQRARMFEPERPAERIYALTPDRLQLMTYMCAPKNAFHPGPPPDLPRLLPLTLVEKIAE